MASEQFSLCWDNFHKNMSSGLNALLENEDLVDVTLAVDGKFFKAHQMVLSVCSPYFKELFKANPCQHPIVFLKDVSYVAISDLLQFMYQGEVQVSQDNLTTFIKTAEALQIKGLTGDGNGTEADSEPPQDKPAERHVEETYKPMPRPKKVHPAPIVTTTPAIKKPRLSLSSNDQSSSAPITKAEPAIESSQFKVEPFDPSQSVTIPDDGDETFGDETLDDTTVDDNEDYSMMEGEEPQAGTSTDGAGEGQEDLLIKIEKSDEDDLKIEIAELAENVELNLIPEKSRKVYEQTYRKFMDYRIEKKIGSLSENIVVAYFAQLSHNMKSPSLWSCYSMLKTTLKLNDNVDISRYMKLRAFLKRKSLGYQAKKCRVLEREHIEKFLLEAPDKDFLSTKVALIFGVAGACRSQELVQMKITDIVDMNDKLLITLPDTQTKKERSFLVTEHLNIYRKYTAARPSIMNSQRFFFKYNAGKSYKQVIGIHKFGKMPQEIAMFLKLPNAKEYTGHCLRRTSATLLANSRGENYNIGKKARLMAILNSRRETF